MISNDITYVIASRNNLSSLCACIASLNSAHKIALPNSQSDLIVVNDSTFDISDSSIKDCIDSLRLSSLRPFVIGQNYFYKVRSKIASILNREAKEKFNFILRPLGSDGWNLYSARNLAWLYIGSIRQKDDLICMIDDDVMTGPTVYKGINFVPTVCQFLKQAKSIAKNASYLAVGPRFLGREDVSCLRHIIKSIRKHSLHSNCSFYSIIPYSYPFTFHELDRKEPVPSGGFMLTTVNTIRCLPLMPFYNEDWIWARLISSMQKAYVHRVSQFALHAPVATELPTSASIVFQEIGEAIYSTIDLLCKLPSKAPIEILGNFDSKILDSCFRGRLSLLSRYRNEIIKADHLGLNITVANGLPLKEWALITLDDAIKQLKQVDRNAITKWVHSFLEIAYYWPKLFSQVRQLTMSEHHSFYDNNKEIRRIL